MAAAIRLSQQHSCSFDHLIGKREQRRRHGKVEHAGGLVVDHQLELARLHDWQVSRLCTLEDATGINANLAVSIRQAGAIAHEPASLCKIAQPIPCRKPVECRQLGELNASGDEERANGDKQRIWSFASHSLKRSIDLAGSVSIVNLNL